jgi:hypothetical protein
MMALERLLIVSAVIILVLFGAYRMGYSNGVKYEKGVWDQREQGYKNAELHLRHEHMKNVQRILDTHQQTNLKNHHDHETALTKVRVDLTAARAESKRLGGLRIAVPSCPGDRTWAIAQATSTSQRDEATTTTIALPERIEEDLWTVVGHADEIVEQARACQAWIRDNGFYGELAQNPAKAD